MKMKTNIEGVPLSEFIGHVLRETVRADAEAQLFQQAGWREFHRSFRESGGIDVTAGIPRNAYLGLRELKLSFYVEPIREGCWAQIGRFFRRLLGRRGPPARRDCRLVIGPAAAGTAFLVTVTAGRGEDGGFAVRTDPDMGELEGVYVDNIIA